MNLLTGQNESGRITTFWDLWKKDLKVSFNKKSLKKAMSERWNITERNVEERLKDERFKVVSADIAFLYENYCIGYDMQVGFFFDEKAAELKEKKEMMEDAKLFGMSK